MGTRTAAARPPTRHPQSRKRTTAPKGGGAKGRTPTSPPADPTSPDAGKPNWKDKTIFTGDNLHVLRGMNSDSVDLIYLDPPFNSNRDYAAPIGGGDAIAAFKDTWHLSDVDKAWHDQLELDHPVLHNIILAAWAAAGKRMASYLMMMGVRLLELKRVLKPSGSIFLHCDDTAGAYLKMLMDSIFGRKQFRNEIAWCYGSPGRPNYWFPRKHDIILFYAMPDQPPLNHDDILVPHKRIDKKISGGWTSRAGDKYTQKDVNEVAKGKTPFDWWDDIAPAYKLHSERTGYPTQKPLKLLERIIRASSNPGDVVLDPFCGCATAAVAAEKLGRQWVGIDLSPVAADMVRKRLKDDLGLMSELAVHRTIGKGRDQLMRTDLGKLPHYRTHKGTLFGEQEGYCAGCGYDFAYDDLEVDHIIAEGKGGTDHKANLQLLCRRCNSRKGTGEMSELVAELIEDRIGQWR